MVVYAYSFSNKNILIFYVMGNWLYDNLSPRLLMILYLIIFTDRTLARQVDKRKGSARLPLQLTLLYLIFTHLSIYSVY